MLEISKEDVLVLENQSGGRSGITVERNFSSRLLYRQFASNGGLDLSRTEERTLRKSDLEKYDVVLCSSVEEAEQLVYEESQDVELLDGMNDFYEF